MANKSVYQIIIELENDKQTKAAFEEIGKSVGLAGAALTAFAAGAAKLASDYEKSLGDVAIVIDEQTGTAQELSGAIFDLQGELNGLINVQQAAEASAELLSSGIKGQTTILNALESSQKAAVAGQSDLNTISSAAAGVVNSYGDALGEGLTQGEKFNKVVDLILRTQIDGVVTADEYARSIGNVASLAAISGISLEELNGIIALSTEKGTKGSIAINNFKSAVSNITAPTATAKEEAKELGIQFDAARLKAVGFQQIIADVFTSENFDEASVAKLFGSQEAQAIVSQVGSDLDGLTAKIENQANGLGTLDEAYDKVDETVNQRVINSLNLLQGSLIKIGTGVLIAFEPLIASVAKAAELLASLPTPVLAIIGAVTGLTGVALTGAGATLLLATSIGAIKGNLEIGLPFLIRGVKGISALAASALSGSIGLKSFNLSLLTSNAQLNLLAASSKKALVALAPIATLLIGIGGAAASVGLVVDTLNKLDVAADKNQASLDTLREKLLEIKKAGEGTTPEVAKEEGKLALENLNKEIGFLQRQLDKLRGQDGLGTALEGAANRGSIAFGELATEVQGVEQAAADLLTGGLDFTGALSVEEADAKMKAFVESLAPEKIAEVTKEIDASIESLEASTVTSETDILARDAQITRLQNYKNTLTGVTTETENNTSATETQTQTVEDAAKAYDDYAKQVQASVQNIENRTKNSIAELQGSESDKIQNTLRLQEESTNAQIALLENLKNQSQTTAQERVALEIEIQTKQTDLNKARLEANKALEEQYNQFLRDSLSIREQEFLNAQTIEKQTVAETFEVRKTLIQDGFELEASLIEDRLADVVEGSAEEKALKLELAELTTSTNQELAALDEELHQEKLARIQEAFEAESAALDFTAQAQEIRSQIVSNSNAALDSQASILSKISGLLEGDNATLEQREQLVSLLGSMGIEALNTENAQFNIQQTLAQIEVQKLDLKIKQLEIDKEQLKIANEIKQLEIQNQIAQNNQRLRDERLTSDQRQSLERQNQNLQSQSNLENQKTNLSREAIDSQLGFADIEKRLAEIISSGIASVGAGENTGNVTVSQLKERALENNSISEVGQARYDGLITREEYQDIFDALEEKRSKDAEALVKEQEKATKEQERTATNTETLASSQDETSTQIAGNTEEIRNVSGSIGSLVEVAQSQLQIQTRMSARLDQISKQLDVLPGAIASRLPRPTPQVPTRR